MSTKKQQRRAGEDLEMEMLSILRDLHARHVTVKKLFLRWLADEEFRDQILAALGLDLVGDKLQELEDRVANLEHKQQE